MSTPMQSRPIEGSPYGYSGTRLSSLGATEYSLVAIAADVSGSVYAFEAEMEACIKEIVAACRHSPRADNLMLRLTRFANDLEEVHGFKPLMACAPNDYDGSLPCGGGTALYDGAHNAVAAVTDYGRALVDQGLAANGIVFVITDGCDNSSLANARAVRDAIENAVTSEALASVLTVLVGVNVNDGSVGKALMRLSTEVGFDQYIEIDKADADSLRRLARFATASIAVTSTALGSGMPVKSLTF